MVEAGWRGSLRRSCDKGVADEPLGEGSCWANKLYLSFHETSNIWVNNAWLFPFRWVTFCQAVLG